MEVLMVPIIFIFRFVGWLRHFFVSFHDTKELVTLDLSNYYRVTMFLSKSFAPPPPQRRESVCVIVIMKELICFACG